MMQNDDIKRLAVVGCGTVGLSWAALFLANDLEVVVYDPMVSEAGDLLRAMGKMLADLRAIGLDGGGSLSVAASPEEACEAADFVQENTPERQDEKSYLLGRLDEASPNHAIIASSTSSLLWSDITGQCAGKDRVIIGHPFNPPHLIPLVEIFGTEDAVVARAMTFYSRIGKRPVRLKQEMRGHIANRLSSAVFREAVHLVEQGVASVADIDAALRDGPGLRWAVMGPHLAYHLGGGSGGIRHYLEHLGSSQERRWEDLGHPRLTHGLRELLIAGIEDETGGADIPELERKRDRALIRILKNRGVLPGTSD